jgi:dipeptidyl aminopeptidase/acylaminoacyl peptidase
MAWAPDSLHLVISRRQPGQRDTLTVLDIETEEVRPFWGQPDKTSGDTDPQFSPNGLNLAFTRDTEGATSSIYVVPVSPAIVPTATPVRLTSSTSQRSYRPIWTPDSKEILFLHGTLANYRLWRMNADGSALRPFPEPGGPTYLGSHIAHRDQLRRLTDAATERGDTEVAELNATMLDKVTKLIDEIGPTEQDQL